MTALDKTASPHPLALISEKPAPGDARVACRTASAAAMTSVPPPFKEVESKIGE